MLLDQMKADPGVASVRRIIALSSLLVAWLAAAPDVSATIHNLVANMSGAQENPPIITTGTGTCAVTLNDVTRQVTVSGTYQSLTGTASLCHIHGPAPVGMNANVVISLTQSGGTSGTISGGGTLTAQQVLDMLNGLHYVNLHSSFAGGGEIRGQVFPPPPPSDPADPGRTVTASKGAGTSVGVTYPPACGATDHVAYWGQAGPGTIVGPLSWIGSACGLGTSGAGMFDPGAPPERAFFYFVVVGQNASVQGSFGRSSAAVQRPEAVGVGLCDLPQSLNVTCP